MKSSLTSRTRPETLVSVATSDRLREPPGSGAMRDRARTRTPRRSTRPPGRRMERDLLASGHRLVAGMDEVGRGALAGPVSVGVVVVDESTGRLPRGLRDSKLRTPAARAALSEPARAGSAGGAGGSGEPEAVGANGTPA